ncbi:hypothetical protein [Acinetobacter baumannii]|uniref:hypothetical protein n=1 Tax=Acinetobacter baumannii TaxID=470 RepID=UPI001EF11B34|nr:hypothetical protein [Acinetobacter baumannii]MCG6614541.1 hypothetical protein [Acinetobacter baumannii]
MKPEQFICDQGLKLVLEQKEPAMSEFKVGDKALFPVRLGNSVEWCEGRISAYRSDMNKFDLCGVRHWGWYFAHELKHVTEVLDKPENHISPNCQSRDV